MTDLPPELAGPEHPDRRRLPPIGQVVLGVLLVAVGIAWLLQAVGGIDFRWDLLLPLALLIVGGGLVAGARTGAHGGLIGVGVVLTVVVAVASSIGGIGDVPFSGGFGERRDSPAALDGGEAYRLAVGELEVDLRNTELPAGELIEVTASVAIGRLVVLVPANVTVRVEARAAAGNVSVFGEQSSGLDAEIVTRRDGAGSVLVLDADVGLGEVVVR